MHSFFDLFTTRYLWCGLTAWFVAQIIKVPTYYRVEKRINWKRALEAGGMPSSHTATTLAVTLLIGATEGFDSAIFALGLAFCIVVMYDATGVRRETGKQGAVINEILRKVLIDGKPISDDEFKELVGHSPLEVTAGAILGILVALPFILIH